MRILLLNQYYPPDLAPTGSVLHDLARDLQTRGHEIHVVCSRASYDSERLYSSEELIDDIHIHRISTLEFSKRHILSRFGSYASYFARTWSIMRKLPRPQCVVSLTTPPYIGLLGSYVSRRWNISHVSWVMDLYPDILQAHGLLNSKSIIYDALKRISSYFLNHSDLIVTLGPWMASRVDKYLTPGRHSTWIPLWATQDMAPWATGLRNSIREANRWGPEELVIMYSGNMGLGHTFDDILWAAQKIGRSGVRWVFSGGGRRHDEIKKFASSHPELPIDLLPYARPVQLREHLSAADLHLVTLHQSWQGLMVPSKIHAIFALGKPVLYVGGSENEIASWIREAKAGWVVNQGDREELLKAIDESRDPSTRRQKGESAARFAKAHFSQQTNCNRISQSLEKLL